MLVNLVTSPTRSTGDAGVAVEGLSKAFAGNVAVDDLSLSVEPGEIVGLLGPNGAGKTTTISCMGGLLRPDRGAVTICGEDALRRGRRTRRHLGIATQRLGLYPYLDVEANLRFFAALRGAPPRELDRLVTEIAEPLQLGALLATPVGRLSTGQQRLAHVASAMIGRPAVLLLDEATANLDVSARHVVLEMVRRLAAEGTAVLYSSHYLGEIEDLCGRVVILFSGRVLADGDVGYLVERHGGGRVELTIDGRTVVRESADLGAALRSVASIERIDSVRVVRPSLETVFLALTGAHMDVHGFVTGEAERVR
jgi:ABC-2 type transport system ATP-binding protein